MAGSVDYTTIGRDRPLHAAILVLGIAGVAARFTFSLGPRRPDFTWITIFLSLTIAQATLLGIWGALSRLSPDRRIFTVALGAFALWTLMSIEAWGDMRSEAVVGTLLVYFIPTGMVMAATSIVLRKLVLQWCDQRELPEESDTLQFEIKHILIATAVSAVLVTLGKLVRAFYFEGHPDRFLAVFIFAVWLGLAYPATAVVATWAALGLNRPGLRLIMVAVVALSMAFVPLSFFPFDNHGAVVYISSCLAQAAMVTAILLIARSAGYRLVPKGLQSPHSYTAPNPPPAPP